MVVVVVERRDEEVVNDVYGTLEEGVAREVASRKVIHTRSHQQSP